jgi:hypothetical protein
METLRQNTFENAGNSWSQNEINTLINHYTNKNSILDISILMKRTMYSIICKLHQLKQISEKENAIGYDNYIKYKDAEYKLRNSIKNTDSNMPEKENNLHNELNDQIINDYNNNIDINEISKKYNIPITLTLQKLKYLKVIIKFSQANGYKEYLKLKKENNITDNITDNLPEDLSNEINEINNTLSNKINLNNEKIDSIINEINNLKIEINEMKEFKNEIKAEFLNLTNKFILMSDIIKSIAKK